MANTPARPEQASIPDSLNAVHQRVGQTLVILKILANGRARTVLTESERDELDWLLLAQVENISDELDSIISIAEQYEREMGARHG